MNQCESCSAPTDLFLCQDCTTTLRANLTKLVRGPYIPAVGGRTKGGGEWYIERRTPGLLDNLADVVLKQTRMGGSSGHRKRGDEMPAPFEPDTTQGRWTAQGTADNLLVAAGNHLSTIVRDLCESRGGTPRTTGADPVEMAAWLVEHVHAIACDESAGQHWAEIDNLTRQIERAIDRPDPPRFCGPCIHYVDHNRHCGRLLYAPRYRTQGGRATPVLEVTCQACRTTHNIDTLTRHLENRADSLRFTSAEILTIMQTLGKPIPERSWRRWRKEGRVKARGYKRPDNDDGTRGSIGMVRRTEADEPVYRLAEVRKLYASAIRHSDADSEMSYA